MSDPTDTSAASESALASEVLQDGHTEGVQTVAHKVCNRFRFTNLSLIAMSTM
jgi:hypothetical protein